jgi:site-specific recombinase XerD
MWVCQPATSRLSLLRPIIDIRPMALEERDTDHVESHDPEAVGLCPFLSLDELTRIESKDLTRSGRQAHLRVLGKRGRIRDVPVPPSLLRRLDRFIESRPDERTSDQIFLTHRRRDGLHNGLTNMGVYQVVKFAFQRTRLTKHVYPHLLRHSWMTEMLRNGMNPIQLSIIAGASPEVIASHYTHLNKDDAYEAMIRALGTGRR